MAEFFRTVRGLDEEGKQRVRRSEALLSQLYVDDLKRSFRIPQVRWLRPLVVFSALAVLLFTGTLFFKFNSFVLLREDVLTKSGNLASAVQRRTNLFSNLINVALNHAALEHSVFTNTSKMRTEIIKNIDLPKGMSESLAAKVEAGADSGKSGDLLPTDWAKAAESLLKNGNMGSSLGRLLAVVEQYPNIQSSKTYQQLMTSLVEMEDLIAGRRVEYNMVLRDYNTAISKFPWYMLAKVTDFKRVTYYAAGSDDTAAPVITPTTFKLLLPTTAEGKELAK
jgi:LemA protein